jgi:hypothetical protein
MEPLFLLFVVILLLICIGVLVRFAPNKSRWFLILGLLLWVVYAGIIGSSGVVRDTSQRVPGLFLLVGPMVLLTAFGTTRSHVAKELARAIPMTLLIGLQSFRLIVELFLHALWKAKLVPRMVTFEGANFDIFIGVSALALAALIARKKISRRLLLAWNILGLLLLLNVVVRGALTAPGPLQRLIDDYPNRALLQFPFTYIPGLMVPLALMLHVLALRALDREESQR